MAHCHLAGDCEIDEGSDDDPMQLPGPKGFSILVVHSYLFHVRLKSLVWVLWLHLFLLTDLTGNQILPKLPFERIHLLEVDPPNSLPVTDLLKPPFSDLNNRINHFKKPSCFPNLATASCRIPTCQRS